ncbi:MAG: hypothetical protein U9R40_05480 [Synergistota bacterium]|nr:hypothetical protein [Synergistota bacterium]
MSKQTGFWIVALVITLAFGWVILKPESQGIEVLNSQTESLLAEMRKEGYLVVRTVGSG